MNDEREPSPVRISGQYDEEGDFDDFEIGSIRVNGASVLRLIRDGVAGDLESIAASLDPGSRSIYMRYDLRRILNELADAGLVQLQDDPAPSKIRPGSDVTNVLVEITTKWPAIARSLGLSLKKLAQKNEDALEVMPFFGAPTKVALDVFVLMPFDPKLLPIYNDHIKKVAESLKLRVQRADDFFNTNHLMADIWKAIWNSRLVIADCTGRNANVFYEIGVAHTLGRPVVLITPNGDDVPADLRHVRYIKYEYTPRGMADFERSLELTIKSALPELVAGTGTNAKGVG